MAGKNIQGTKTSKRSWVLGSWPVAHLLRCWPRGEEAARLGWAGLDIKSASCRLEKLHQCVSPANNQGQQRCTVQGGAGDEMPGSEVTVVTWVHRKQWWRHGDERVCGFIWG